jgi:hypothetical protein
MHSGIRLLSMAAASALVLSLSSASASAAEPCVSGAQVRSDVAELVADLRDDVKSSAARSATAHALGDALHTFRGVDADTAAERRELGEEISALAQQLNDAENLVERKALVADILALTEQRERGAFTDEERAELRAAVVRLKSTIVDRTDSRAEGQAVAAAFRDLHEQFNCRA